MNHADELRDTYNHIAADYTADHLHDTWDDNYRELFCNLLAAGSEVLDLGCGPGTDGKLLIESGLRVTGLDLSDELLKIARDQNPGTTFVQGDMRQLPFTENSFDAVFAKASLLHIEKSDMSQVLNEIHRVTKHDGIVHIAIKGGEGEKVEAENSFGYEFKRFFAYWEMDEFTSLLQNGHFEIVNSDTRQGKTTTWLQFILRIA